jgi:hypothetical protein
MPAVEGPPEVQLIDPEDGGLAMVQIVNGHEALVCILQPLEALDFAVRIVNAAADAFSGERHLVVRSPDK